MSKSAALKMYVRIVRKMYLKDNQNVVIQLKAKMEDVS